MVKTATTYATRSFTVPANGSVEFVRTASFLTVLDASAAFEISFDNGPRSAMEAGLTLRTQDDFQRVEIINTTGSVLTVKVGLGRGDVRDSRLTLSGSIQADIVAPDVLTTGAPVAAANAAVTLLAAADANRREVLAVVDLSAGGAVYIGGDAAAAAGEGLPVQPGQSLTLTTSAAVYVRNDTGAAVNVSKAEFGVV